MKGTIPAKWEMVATAIYMLLILISSIIPMDREIKGFQFLFSLKPGLQNLLHVPVFAFLSVLWFRIMRCFKIEYWLKIIYIIIITCGYGVINEMVQMFIPGRYASLIDLCLNSIGSVFGIFLYVFIEKSQLGFIKRIICG
jgi:VanZ family protein